MPIEDTQLSDNLIVSKWTYPLRSQDLSASFEQIRQCIDANESATHILFDINEAGNIPSQAPFLFIRSELTRNPKLGRMAVIGTNPIAQILAQMAVKMSSQNILFFSTEEDALAYLND